MNTSFLMRTPFFLEKRGFSQQACYFFPNNPSSQILSHDLLSISSSQIHPPDRPTCIHSKTALNQTPTRSLITHSLASALARLAPRQSKITKKGEGVLMIKTLLSKKFYSKFVILTELGKYAHWDKCCAPLRISNGRDQSTKCKIRQSFTKTGLDQQLYKTIIFTFFFVNAFANDRPRHPNWEVKLFESTAIQVAR